MNTPLMKVLNRRECVELETAGIENISLCDCHIPGCVEMVINHSEKWGSPLELVSIETDLSRADKITLYFEKFVINKIYPIIIELSLLPPELVELLEHCVRYTNKTKTQQLILFTPYPANKQQEDKTGKIIATI